MTRERAMVACDACGLIQTVDGLAAGTIAKCTRCRLVLKRRQPDTRNRTLAIALAALMLYFPANLTPILRAEYLGAHTQTKLFDGIQALFQKGNYLVGGLVFVTSVVAPGIQIVGWILLCLTLRPKRWQKFRSLLYRTVQKVDPWNMLPVTLLALLVALAELGQVAKVHPGPGVFAYAGMVALATWAGFSFDPQLLWPPVGAEETHNH